MHIIGIDPGVSGGIAVIPLYSFKETRTYSLSKMSATDISNILRDFREDEQQVEVFIEQPSLNPFIGGKPCPACKKMPMRNAQSFAKLGRSLGKLEGICTAFNYIPNLISPMKWQNFLNCRTGGDKKVTHKLATKLFPLLTKTLRNGEERSTVTHQTADALLIALYGYLQYANPQYIPKSIKEHTNARSIQRSTISDRYGPVRVTAGRRCPPRRNGTT